MEKICMKIVDKKAKTHTLVIEGVLDVVNDKLCLIEFDGDGDPIRAIALADLLEQQELLGKDVKIKIDEPTEKEEVELGLE